MTWFDFMQESIAIDLGTANTLIIHNDQVVVDEPSIVAKNIRTGEIVAIGKRAQQMHGKTHKEIETLRPLKDGVIADFQSSEQMIRGFIAMIPRKKSIFSPALKMVICIPSGVTEVEKRAVIDSAEHAGAKDVWLIHEPMAAALGIGIDVLEPKGNMVIDIGGGTTEIAVISLGGIVCDKSIKVAGDEFTDNIKNYMKTRHNIAIGDIMAEQTKIHVGSALIELEGLVSSANLKELEVRLTSLRIDLVRLKAELADAKKLEFETDLKENHNDLISAAIERFNTRRSHIHNLISAQRHSVKQREEEAREIRARITKNADSLKFVEEQVSISDGLMAEDLTNRMLHLNLLKERTLIKGALNEDAAATNRIKAAQEEAEVRLSTLHDSYLIETREKFDEIYPLYLELSQRRKKLIDSLKRTVLRAPVDGFIKVLYHSTVGGVVRPGDTVIDLVPKGDRLLVEVRLPVQEVVFISVGQISTVRLAIAGTEKFGQLQGRVVHVSPDSIRLADETPFYIVKIELNGDYFQSKGKKYPLLPGVQVTCSITTGKRSVLEYVLEPFLSIKHTAFQER